MGAVLIEPVRMFFCFFCPGNHMYIAVFGCKLLDCGVYFFLPANIFPINVNPIDGSFFPNAVN